MASNISSSYTVSSSDGPGNQLASCILNGENYLTWSKLMCTALPSCPILSIRSSSPALPAFKTRKICGMISEKGFPKEGLFVSKYYSVLKGLWDELENFLEITHCTCAAAASNASQREKEKSYQFLMGINPEFSTVRSNILSMEPSPSLNKIYSMIIHEERQKIVSCVSETGMDAAAFLVRDEGGQSEI
ncbi:hypothetical protein CRG98_025060 [Punica granatum]|uniref:Retrotransposon Copia-like N-terminal domain-containing protein n=1 Tax=Punica granatum TaxID=22663 RepID=A0A2I0JFX4_PUNGR|nr:hypothetical protein CRG98_025060 [Punica granatum]